VRPSDTIIDATAGNGHDTLTLARLLAEAGGGSLWACDIQLDAIRRAQARMRDALASDIDLSVVTPSHESTDEWTLITPSGVQVSVRWRHGCHQALLRELKPACVRLVVFNLGYLPGGDKSVVTTAEGTVAALREAQRVVCGGGTVSATVYPGHVEGEREEQAVLEHARALKQEEWSVYHHKWLNQRNKRTGRPAPSLVLIQRLHLGKAGVCESV